MSSDSTRPGAVGDLDAQHESHPVEECEQTRALTRVEQQPGGLAVVEDAHRVFDASARVEQESLGRHARREAGEALRRERVEPGEPVGPGHRDHGPVRQVDDGGPGCELPLLTERVAVVLGRGTDRAGASLEGVRPLRDGRRSALLWDRITQHVRASLMRES